MALDWLNPPYEFLVPGPGVAVIFRVTRYQVGFSQRRIDEAPGSKVFETLRLQVPAEDKPAGPPYWDITSQRLQAALAPILPDLVEAGSYLQVVKVGSGPSADWSIAIRPDSF